MMHVLKNLNYWLVYSNYFKDKSSNNNLNSNFIITFFGVHLISIGIRLVSTLGLGLEWGMPNHTSQDLILFDVIILCEFFIALCLISKLKEGFLNFYLCFYPSVKLLSFFVMVVTFFTGIPLLALGELGKTLAEAINYGVTAFTYCYLFYLPLRKSAK